MEIVSELAGRKVTVFTEQGEQERQDVGTLERVEGNWIKMRKDSGEVLYFSALKTRLIKPFDPV